MCKNNIVRDTFILTVVQISLRCLSMLMNIFITHELGSVSVGVVSLIYSFFGLISVISSGNIFICMSRFAAEEIGKDKGNPSGIFRYGLIFCIILSFSSAAGVFLSAQTLGEYFLKDSNTIIPIRIMSLCLPISALTSCIKGYFNAYRKSVFVALADIIEFTVRSGITAFTIEFMVTNSKISLFSAIAFSLIAGEAANFIFLISVLHTIPSCGNSRIKISGGFFKFIIMILPITFNSYITVILSSINDLLLPMTLKQYGNSTQTALSHYGILEAIIMPCLYFPSVIVSSLSGILVPEMSMAEGAEEHERAEKLAEKSIYQTIWYSIYSVSIMLVCGDEFGKLLSGGDEFAGEMIKVLSFVIPFIYLEIILESIIRAMGMQKFSSLNYIAEYIIRISVLLICVPIAGFYGIIISYYSSNIISNILRLVMIRKKLHISMNPLKLIVMPLLSVTAAWQISSAVCTIASNDIIGTIIYIIISAAVYYAILCNVKYPEYCLPTKIKFTG